VTPLLFLDANVLFTAAHTDQGYSRALFRLSETGFCRLATSRFAADEALRNIGRKAPSKKAQLERLIQTITVVPEPSPAAIEAVSDLPLPAKDLPILAAAAAAGCPVLVTGDRRHFGALLGRTVHGVKTLSPRDAFHSLVVLAID